jgi:two-component sensor histidine kinase
MLSARRRALEPVNMTNQANSENIENMLDDPGMAEALQSDQFRQILDGLPIAIAVSEIRAGRPETERLSYVNQEFERLTGRAAATLEGAAWSEIAEIAGIRDRLLASGTHDDDFIGCCEVQAEITRLVDWWANVIRDAAGNALFRIVAAAESTDPDREAAIRRIREKETALRELQHRVGNNLQIITTLIRIEARSLPPDMPDAPFERLAGRVGALATLYRLLSESGSDAIDLGTYLSQIAASVMTAHATEGIRLDLKVDAYPVSLDVAMPTGLIVNELMTNALKHAFAGRDGGTITLHSLTDGEGCRITIADDGPGLSDGETWPRPGKLGALIVRSLKENAGADLAVVSEPGQGVRATIRFPRARAAPGG